MAFRGIAVPGVCFSVSIGQSPFGAVALTAFEGLAAGLSLEIAKRFPLVDEQAHRRGRKSGVR